MLIRKEEQTVLETPNLQGGFGTPVRRIILPPEEAAGSGRLFAVFTLQPGDSIGYHKHTGEFEIYFVLSGAGEVTEDGKVYTIREGDMAQCKDGSSHGVVCVGEEPLVFLAVILNTKE